VWRRRNGVVEVLVVHRPRYDDWTLPKGKLGPGEDYLEGALREVREETGLRCTPGPELASSAYVDNEGRTKLVRYWAMTVAGDDHGDGGDAGGYHGAPGFEPNDEVDEVRWEPLVDARRLLSYPRDRQVLDSLAAAGALTPNVEEPFI
jgi:8-oxo-dGTP diphosphatase